MNTATMKYFTDLAAEMGWEYVIVDWGWYGPITDFETGGERDCTKPVAAVDVPEIVRYAKAKNVKVAASGSTGRTSTRSSTRRWRCTRSGASPASRSTSWTATTSGWSTGTRPS